MGGAGSSNTCGAGRTQPQKDVTTLENQKHQLQREQHQDAGQLRGLQQQHQEAKQHQEHQADRQEQADQQVQADQHALWAAFARFHSDFVLFCFWQAQSTTITQNKTWMTLLQRSYILTGIREFGVAMEGLYTLLESLF